MTQNFKTLFYDGEDKKILVFREEDRNHLFMPDFEEWQESDKQLSDIIRDIFLDKKPFKNLVIEFLIGNSIIKYSSDEYEIEDLRENTGKFTVYIPNDIYNNDDDKRRKLENKIRNYFFRNIKYNYELGFIYKLDDPKANGSFRISVVIICGKYALWDVKWSKVIGML